MSETPRLFSLRRERRKAYELLGERFIQRFTSAVRRETWGRTALQLAWTAGPVTYLGLQAGYRIGFGEAAPPDLFLYFAIYTVVAGVFAILIRIGYSALRGQEREEAAQTLRDVVDKIPDLIGAVRNVSLEEYDAADRRVIAARYILENPDAGEAAVGQVVEGVTGDAILASAARTVEIYRRAGLKTAIWDVHEEHQERLGRALERVRARSVTVADLIRKRFIGLAPGKRRGRARTEGFIERVLTAAETDDRSIMTFADVEEVLTLAFEFLVGREFPIVNVEYIGARAFQESSHSLEHARREFRAAVRVRNSRLRIMAELLNESKAITRVPAAISTFAAVRDVATNVLDAITSYHRDLQRRLAGQRRRLRFLFPAPPVEGSEIEFFQELVRIYDKLYHANLEVRKKHVALRRAMRNYDQTRASWVGHFTPRIITSGERGPGIRLHRRAISLNEGQRLSFAAELGRILEDVAIQPGLLRAYTESDEGAVTYLSATGYKLIAFETLHALDRVAGLTKGDTQYALESTNAPNIGALERGLSREVKWGWAVSLVNEIRTDVSAVVLRLSRNLAAQHGAELTEESKEYLHAEFGVPRRLLTSQGDTHASSGGAGELALDHIESQLMDIPPISRDFRDLVQYLD